MQHSEWVRLAWISVSCSFVLFTVTALGLANYFSHNKKVALSPATKPLNGSLEVDVEEVDETTQLMIPEVQDFITARGRASVVAVAWSFYATAVGSWVIVGPPSYAVYAGVLGLVMYSLSSGIPLLGIAFFGSKIQAKYPHISSSSEFVGERFGRKAQFLYVLLIMFNMSIAMLAEYTTIASLFRDFVRTLDFPVIVAEGTLALMYTAYGGLYVSIITDQFQGVFSLLLTVIIAVYVFTQTSLDPKFSSLKTTPLSDSLRGLTLAGYSSIFVQPISLSASTVFLESMWQKCWASSDRKSLYVGSTFGCVIAILIVFFFGMCGIIAAWVGLIDYDTTNQNLYLFQLFKTTQTADGQAILDSWPSLLVLVAAAIMSQSAVDSLQNGMMGTLSCYFLKGKPLWATRLMVICINFPLILLAIAETSVLQIFLLGNMMCTACAIPFFTGAFLSSSEDYSEKNLLFSVAFGVLMTSMYGVIQRFSDDGFFGGIWFAWYGNGYLWDYFAVTFGSSLFGTLLSVGYSRYTHQRTRAQVQILDSIDPE
jgi:SSS family solute:Na+ symporter